MKIVAITQARISSTRLPKKVLLPIGDQTLLGLQIERLKKVKLIDELILATTFEEESHLLLEIAKSTNIKFFQGSLDDVLDRFYQAALSSKADLVIRLTSDCPLIDPTYVQDLIQKFLNANVDYASNAITPNLPDGMDAEIMTFKTLENAWKNALLKSDREHVTPYIWRNSSIKGGTLFRGLALNYNLHLQNIRLTVDQPEDYEVIKAIVKHKGSDVTMQEAVDFLIENPSIQALNSDIVRNEGYLKSLNKD